MGKTPFEATHWEKAAKTRMGRYLTKIESDFVFKSIAEKKLENLLDVGAEAGRFSSLPTGTATVTIGIDIDSYGLKRLRFENKHVCVIQADARKIPLKNEVFDAVFMIEVLDYISDAEATLNECNRVLKSKASLFLSFGNRSSLKSIVRELFGKSYRHSYGRIKLLLSNTGFELKGEMGYNWLPLGRISENRLIPFLIKIERLFGLRRIPKLSPWVIVEAEKLAGTCPQ